MDARGDAITYFEPGETIKVTWVETINHPGHFRISFDEDGFDDFVDPASYSDFYTAPTVLLDDVPDTGGSTFSADVTLPNIECDNCTLQLIQVMTDKPPFAPGTNDIYYQCADLVLRAAGRSGGGTGSSTGSSSAGTGASGSGGAGAGSGGGATGAAAGPGGGDASAGGEEGGCAMVAAPAGGGCAALLLFAVSALGMRRLRSFGFQRNAWSAPLKIWRCSAIDPTTVSSDEPLYTLPKVPASISWTTSHPRPTVDDFTCRARR